MPRPAAAELVAPRRSAAAAAVWLACRAGGEALLVLAATGALSAGALLLR